MKQELRHLWLVHNIYLKQMLRLGIRVREPRVVKKIDTLWRAACDAAHTLAGGGRFSSRGPMLTLVMLFLVVAPAASARGPDSNTDLLPVLLVHGSGLDASYWKPLIVALEAEGYDRSMVEAVNMLPRDGSNTRAAMEYIDPAVERLLGRVDSRVRTPQGSRPRKIILVSHSMGAVSTRWYATRIAPQRVAGWIAIAGANRGTNSLCGYSGAGDRQMCPAYARSAAQSWIQVALNGTPERPRDETPFGIGVDSPDRMPVAPDRSRRISYWTLRTEPDRWIEPASSAQIDGAGGLELVVPPGLSIEATSPGNYLLRRHVEHDDLPADPRVVRWVVELVRAINRDYASQPM